MTAFRSENGVTISSTGPDALSNLLDEFSNVARSLGVPVDEALDAGVDAAVVEREFAKVEVVPPSELIAWFGWRNGPRIVDGRTLGSALPHMEPASVARAAEGYAYMQREGAREFWPPDEDIQSQYWPWLPGWVPLETEMRGFIVNTGNDPALPPLVRKSNEEHPVDSWNGSYQIVSLCTLVSAWLEMIDAGVMKWHPEYRILSADRRELPPIYLESGIFD